VTNGSRSNQVADQGHSCGPTGAQGGGEVAARVQQEAGLDLEPSSGDNREWEEPGRVAMDSRPTGVPRVRLGRAGRSRGAWRRQETGVGVHSPATKVTGGAGIDRHRLDVRRRRRIEGSVEETHTRAAWRYAGWGFDGEGDGEPCVDG